MQMDPWQCFYCQNIFENYVQVRREIIILNLLLTVENGPTVSCEMNILRAGEHEFNHLCLYLLNVTLSPNNPIKTRHVNVSLWKDQFSR